MGREFAPRDRQYRNDHGQRRFFGGKAYNPPEVQWQTFLQSEKVVKKTETSNLPEASVASERTARPTPAIQRAPKPDFAGKSLQDHVDKGDKFMDTKSGQVLDTHHMLDFRNQTLKAIGHILAHAPSVGKAKPTFRVPFKTQMQHGKFRLEISIEFEVNAQIRGINPGSTAGSPEVQRLARDVMSMASYMVEYVQAGLPAGWGSAYQEEDLKSNYMGIEIGARGAKFMDENPGLSEKAATTRAKDQVFADAGITGTKKSYSTEKKDMDFRFKGGEKVYGDYNPGTGGISLKHWHAYFFVAGKKAGGLNLPRKPMAHIRSLFFKMYRESISKRK